MVDIITEDISKIEVARLVEMELIKCIPNCALTCDVSNIMKSNG